MCATADEETTCQSSKIEGVRSEGNEVDSLSYASALENTNCDDENRWNRERRDIDAVDSGCWEPFEEYVILETYDVSLARADSFAGLRLGVYGDYETVMQDQDIDVNTEWISIAVGSDTAAADNNSAWQYWVVNLRNESAQENKCRDSEDALRWDLRPMYWRRDVDAVDGAMRLTELTEGYPEYYRAGDVTLEYKGGEDPVEFDDTWLSVVTLMKQNDDGALFNMYACVSDVG